LSFAPPTCRMPLGQSQDIPQANPGRRVTETGWCHGRRGRRASVGAPDQRYNRRRSRLSSSSCGIDICRVLRRIGIHPDHLTATDFRAPGSRPVGVTDDVAAGHLSARQTSDADAFVGLLAQKLNCKRQRYRGSCGSNHSITWLATARKVDVVSGLKVTRPRRKAVSSPKRNATSREPPRGM
jgi:hypothetical protein